MDPAAEVLFANERFYQAFGTGDLQGMEDLWAQDVAVSCIHPGHGPLTQRQEIIDSWQQILQGESAAGIECKAPEVMIYGDLAWVICFELLPENYLIATNIFVHQKGDWKIVHHQAGPTMAKPPEEEGATKITN